MKEKFKQLPQALQKQIIYRFLFGGIFLALFFIILICFRDYYLYIPAIFFALFLIVNGAFLLYNCIKGDYLCVEGICKRVEVTGFRKRIKSIYADVGDNTLRIMIKQRLKNVAVGDTIVVYLAEKTPVYDQDGGYMINSYHALEISKGV